MNLLTYLSGVVSTKPGSEFQVCKNDIVLATLNYRLKISKVKCNSKIILESTGLPRRGRKVVTNGVGHFISFM
jgi:hypothetical protein